MAWVEAVDLARVAAPSQQRRAAGREANRQTGSVARGRAMNYLVLVSTRV